jgi:hypothetical protein
MFDDTLFEPSLNQNWHMLPGERAALMFLLNRMKPDVSIEIGTFQAGSLRPIAALSKRVVTFDVDPNQHRIAPLFPNVRFVTGDTFTTLRPVIDELNGSREALNFILIDGSHEEEGVHADIVNCLRYVPKSSPCVIAMHDSSNPAVRKGIAKAPWASSPFVHGVDLDFVHGALYERADIRGQIWGGLALAVMRPEKRVEPLVIGSQFEYSRQAMLQNSVYQSSS